MDFKIISIDILEGCNPKYVKNLKCKKYSFTKGVTEGVFGKNISISAIVGKNGAGKSTLLDLMFRIINNFNFCLLARRHRCENLEHIFFIEDLRAKLNYSIDDIVCKCPILGSPHETE